MGQRMGTSQARVRMLPFGWANGRFDPFRESAVGFLVVSADDHMLSARPS
jgi:hypothetical protein